MRLISWNYSKTLQPRMKRITASGGLAYIKGTTYYLSRRLSMNSKCTSNLCVYHKTLILIRGSRQIISSPCILITLLTLFYTRVSKYSDGAQAPYAVVKTVPFATKASKARNNVFKAF